MDNNIKDVLVIIPARGGSKGIPNKNIKNFNGDSLLFRTVSQALRIFDNSQVFVSTDSLKYKDLVEEYFDLKIESLRPEDYSTDFSSNDDYIRHAISIYENRFNFKWILILQCTSPFREDNDIKKLMDNRSLHIDIFSSVFETESNPYYLHRILNNRGCLEPVIKSNFTRRQDCPVVYELNGAMFLLNKNSFIENNYSMLNLKSNKPFIMPYSRSIDVDTPLDFRIAEFIDNLDKVE
ncbi:acylneuraminate cytidylyltransferase family protein [Flavobacteriaceae bacterium]|jgi:CMP-N,N'-diacetyllegionaminic acid synthase|nr:acylneuraminate cytidylyltransferase family protein [Flavobacteriaceae bacterium]